MNLSYDNCLILFWLNDEEQLDSHHSSLQEARKRFGYLKDNWHEVFPEGFIAL